MATTTELQAFADRTAFAIPTIDYSVGVPAGTILKSFTTIGSSIPGVIYNPLTNTLHIKTDGVTLSGYNFSGVTVSVEANNVTLKNSYFDAKVGVYSVIQAVGKAGLTVDHSTFDGLKLDRPLADFINSREGMVTITYNQFLNAPSDAIQIKSGVVDHNYFSGAGYATGAHADAISIDGATGKISITNNFIDYRNMADAPAKTTSALAIGNYFGDNQDITVSNNVMLGGAYTVYVQDFGTYKYGAMDITGNYVGGAMFGDLYPNRRPPSLSYDGNGTTATGVEPAPAPAPEPAPVPAPAPAPAPEPAPAPVPVTTDVGVKLHGSAFINGETLQGTSATDWIYGNGGGDKLIGGGGRDFLFSGKGTDIFVYKSLTDSIGKSIDVINGFTARVDKIDLKAIAGATGLTFIGDKAFDGKAGALHAVKSGKSTWVEADMNGDKVADLKIELKGIYSLSAIDFIL
jgi:Ca2+-binding RTX toxin-like protein